ncbi:MAG: hypothetical protein FWE41_05335 [Coriobacteriia bacterium]|nr:hypothetical protein [Coriobacteriia bacterium]MCL2749412.1 hypothetical protein [Coriobacteriia bacterium]
MGLFKSAWMSTNKEKALASVAKLTEVEKLARVADEAHYDEVRVEAAKKLSCSAHGFQGLMNFVRNAERASILIPIVEFLVLRDDKNQLRMVATEAPYAEVSVLALEKLSELHGAERWLVPIAEYSKSAETSVLAVEKLSELQDTHEWSSYGITKMDKQGWLAHIAAQAWLEITRCTAIMHLESIDVLEKLSKKLGDKLLTPTPIKMQATKDHIVILINTTTFSDTQTDVRNQIQGGGKPTLIITPILFPMTAT